MGRIGRVLSFIRRTLSNGAKVTDVKFNPGGGPNITGRHAADAGDDSYPLDTDFVVSIDIPGTGRSEPVAYADTINTPKAQKGDKRIYARQASDGAVVCEVWLKNDGAIYVENENGNLEISPQGNGTLNLQGTLIATVEGNVTINANSNLTAEVADNATINAGGNAEVSATGSITLSAGGDIDISAGGNVNISGTTVNLN